MKADVTREELENSGRTLEELFFAVTEGVERGDMAHEEAAQEEKA